MMDLFPLWLGQSGSGRLQVVENIELQIKDEPLQFQLKDKEEIKIKQFSEKIEVSIKDEGIKVQLIDTEEIKLEVDGV